LAAVREDLAHLPVNNSSAKWLDVMELLIFIIGDLNKLLGNGEFCVEEKVGYGGKLIHNLLSGGKYLLVKNSGKCVGGPFTRVDPADAILYWAL
jgi:hypothetical protein